MSARWRVFGRAKGSDAAAAIVAALDEDALAVSLFEDGADWAFSVYSHERLLTDEREIRLALVAAGAGGELLEIGAERLPERDWVAENQIAFPPLRAGRFWIHGSHVAGRPPTGAIAVEIDAATAFGTGEHASTRGCLLAFDRLTRRRRFRAPLDVGTGTGILAIAAAKLLHREVAARDIDPGSVRVARHNCRRNGVAALIRPRVAAGYRDRLLRRRTYDLVFSNILAKPLARMAPNLAHRLSPGGWVILSGLLRRQEPVVVVAHRRAGLTLQFRIVIDGWSTVVMRRPA